MKEVGASRFRISKKGSITVSKVTGSQKVCCLSKQLMGSRCGEWGGTAASQKMDPCLQEQGHIPRVDA